jgi:short-subunit dehydrogenase
MSTAVVTGASAGLGAAFARRLARDGRDLLLVARREDRLRALGAELESSFGRRCEVLPLDLADRAALARLEARVADAPDLDVLVNNAGFGGYGRFVELEPDRAVELIEVQVVAVTRLTRGGLPGMIRRGRGSVINVASRLAYSASLVGPNLPARAMYAATKAFINAFSQLVANELAGTGVRIQSLCPGLVRTEFHERMGIDPGRFPPAMVMTADDVVTASLKSLELGETICVPALEDSGLLDAVSTAEREMFETSRPGTLARRYRE